MSYRPRRTKPDQNQSQIVRELRARGFDVDIVCDLPGMYDLVVSKSVSVRVEVKSENGELTDTEREYMNSQNHLNSYIIARSTADVLKWFDNGRP